MPVISADIFRLALVKLTGSPLAVPATPPFKLARVTGESLTFVPQTTVSNELDPSGQVKDSILTGATSSGSVDFELTRHDAFLEYLEGVFRNTFGTGQKGDGATPTPTFSAVTANELIPGQVLMEWLIEKRFTDPTGAFLYHRFNKCAFESLSLQVSSNEPITGSVNVNGTTLDLDNAIITGATYADAGNNPVFTAPEVTMISVAAVPYTMCFNSLSLDFNSNIRAIDCIGTLGTKEHALGRFEATISGTAYFQSNDLLQALVDQDKFAVQVTLTDQLGNAYTFDYPVCKLTAVPVNASGTNQDVVANVTIQAIYDSSWGYTCKVTRVLAP